MTTDNDSSEDGEYSYFDSEHIDEATISITPEQYTEMLRKDNDDSPSDVLESVADTVSAKNDDYGSAIEKNAVMKRLLAVNDVELREEDGDVWVRLGSHDVDTVDQQRLDGIFTRLLDKVARLYNLSFTDQSDSVGEKRRETVEDLLGYLAHAAADGFEWGGER